MNSCRVVHIPTGIVEARQGRKRETNLREAKDAILRRLEQARADQTSEVVSTIRKDQMGTGMRGDKIRTYRFQDDAVIDHNSNKRAKCSKIMKGHFDLLWK
jgi:peptide chain release factor 1